MRKLQAEELLQKLSSQVPGGLFQFTRDPGGEFAISYLSAGFRRLIGFQGGTGPFEEMRFADLVHPDDRRGFLSTLRDSGIHMQPWDHEFRVRSSGEGDRWLRVNAIPEAVDERVIWHGYLNDISVRKRHEMEIEKLAFYDPLTGSAQQAHVHGSHEQGAGSLHALAPRARCSSSTSTISRCSTTRSGHDMGDAYLVQVAERLLASVGPRDLVARIGGDEFVVVLEGIGRDRANARRHGHRDGEQAEHGACATSSGSAMFDHSRSASVGVVVFDGSEARAEEILKHADIAMYRAKAAGRNGVAMAKGARLRFRFRAKRLARPTAQRPEIRSICLSGAQMKRPRIVPRPSDSHRTDGDQPTISVSENQ